jgi:hypothetical protein
MTGYVDCACGECFEIAIGKAGKAICILCEEAGCDPADGMGCCVDPSSGLDWESTKEEEDT